MLGTTKPRHLTSQRAIDIVMSTGLKILGPFVEWVEKAFDELSGRQTDLESSQFDLKNEFILLKARVTKLEADAAKNVPAPHLSGVEKRSK